MNAAAQTRMEPARARSGPCAGFSLIELMIAVAIVAVLAMIAYPNYQQAVMRSNRSKAVNALSKVAAEQERFLYAYGRYARSITAARTADPSTSGLGLSDTTRENSSDNSAYYTLSIGDCDTAGPLCYVLKATPHGTLQSRDRCGVLELRSTGERLAKTVAGDAVSGCW